MPPPAGLGSALADAWAELVLGGACVGCRRPGRPLCVPCRHALPCSAARAWPTPTPAGLAPPYATGPYEGVLRDLVVAHKEERVLALAVPLARLLAAAVAATVGDLDPAAPLLLVPAPSRSVAIRRRGYDPMEVLTRRAARLLARNGREVHAAALLRSRPGVADQAGLDAGARAANLAGSMACPSDRVRRLRTRSAHTVLCDDVLTTGATAREGQRALEAAGITVHGIAVIAATRRRHPPASPAATTTRPERG